MAASPSPRAVTVTRNTLLPPAPEVRERFSHLVSDEAARLLFYRVQNQRTIDRLREALDRLRAKHGIPRTATTRKSKRG